MKANLTLLHSEWPKLYGVLAILSAIGLKQNFTANVINAQITVFGLDLRLVPAKRPVQPPYESKLKQNFNVTVIYTHKFQSVTLTLHQ